MANQEVQTGKNGLPPELAAAKKKADRQMGKEAKNQNKQLAKTEKAARKGRKAAQHREPSRAASVFSGFLYGVFFMLLIAGTAVAFYYFDLGNVRQMVISGLKIDQDSYQILDNRRQELTRIEEELETEKQKLQMQQTVLVQEQEASEKLMASLEEKEKTLQNQEQLLSGQQTELSEIISLYESMETEAAAGILSAFENEDDVIRILRNLSQSKASQIMSQFSPELASKVTAKMLAIASVPPGTAE